MLTEYIGQICLNIALVLYLIHFLPQLMHNRCVNYRAQISLHFHGLLSIAYLSDLTFAFGMNMPWQYCLVSSTGVLCLLIQHFQLKKEAQQKTLFLSYQIIISLFLLLFFATLLLKLPSSFFLLMGYVTQAAIWTYTLPQIRKNYISKQGRGLNNLYLGMNLACYGLDVVASMALNWPLPAKLGALFGLGCATILMSQMRFYNKQIVMTEQMT